jgi:hypothetical protein
MRDIVILNDIWTQDKIFRSKYFTYHFVPVLALNYKQYIVSPAKVRKVSYSLA